MECIYLFVSKKLNCRNYLNFPDPGYVVVWQRNWPDVRSAYSHVRLQYHCSIFAAYLVRQFSLLQLQAENCPAIYGRAHCQHQVAFFVYPFARQTVRWGPFILSVSNNRKAMTINELSWDLQKLPQIFPVLLFYGVLKLFNFSHCHHIISFCLFGMQWERLHLSKYE